MPSFLSCLQLGRDVADVLWADIEAAQLRVISVTPINTKRDPRRMRKS
jgi:hypothetical protein